MPMAPFITETYQHRSSNVSASQTLNLYPEMVGQDSKGAARVDIILVGTEGTEIFSNLDSLPSNVNCRGLYYTATSRLFAVYGPNLIEIDSNGVETVRSTALGTLSSVVSMVDNGKYLVLCDGQNLYSFDLDTNVITTPTLAFTNPTKVLYLNQRFVVINNGLEVGTTKSSKNRFYWSALNDATSWDVLNFATAEQSADNIISFSARQNQIWFFGERSYEVWGIASNPDLPYSFVDGSATNVGCGAKNSVVSFSDNVFWLGSSSAGTNQVFISNGYNHRRISNHAIENLLNDSGDRTDDAVGFSYQSNGHVFYVLTFIAINKTFVYDVLTDMWHERGTRDPLLNIVNRYEPIFAAFAYGKTVVGDSKTSKVLRLNLNKYDEWDSRPIVRQHQSPIYYNDLREVIHRRFLLDMENGVGLQSGQGSDPQVMLQHSDDGGHTWSSERWTNIGRIGSYKSRSSWRFLGRARERVYRVRITDPIKVVLIGARVISETLANP